MSAGGRRYPAGSTARLRADVLAVLGVLKVATPEQITRITRPDLFAAGRAEPTKAHRNAALDLARHRETVSEGRTVEGKKLWGLTPLGLESAGRVLDRPLEEMGTVARGVGRHGAAHAMAVNDTVAAFLQPASGRGLGSLAGWSTEVPLPAVGTWTRPGRGGVRADAVLTAPEDNVPLLFVEVDCGHMSAERIAAKLPAYLRFLNRTVKDTDGRPRPMWRTRWPATTGTTLGEGLYPPESKYPPLLLVFTGRSPGGLHRLTKEVCRLTAGQWAPYRVQANGATAIREEDAAYRDYRDALPVLATTLDRLVEHGPRGAVFWRFGHDRWEPLHQALADPDGAQAYRDRRRREEERRQEQQRRAEAEREARLPKCTQCGARFSETRIAYLAGEDGRDDPHPELCHTCAYTVEHDARMAELEAQKAARQAAEEAELEDEDEEYRRSQRLHRRLWRHLRI
ncbi:hypothetical protein E4198_00015 [Streptomyces sp. RKND-216]|uniref:replication-relaxation family protein n=1 Tax=Streptomyces sp. RKND-216 TaxID=2562581 RepID=UPI00109DB558|nr:replication-relaxation family protein [Streptomyces sp. RKND-216]THA28235.1 hypothetical protein E4198_00015 [Streptomyces sp. RKND-216]